MSLRNLLSPQPESTSLLEKTIVALETLALRVLVLLLPKLQENNLLMARYAKFKISVNLICTFKKQRKFYYKLLQRQKIVLNNMNLLAYS